MNDPCVSPHANLPAILGFFECLAPYVSPWVRALCMPLLLLGSSSPYPLFHQLPPFHLHVQYSLFRGVFPNPSASSPSTCIPPLSHSSDCQFLCNLLLDGKLWESRAVSCSWFFPGSWHELILGHCWMDGWRMSDGGVLGGAWLCDDLEMPHIFGGFGDWTR